MALYQLADIKNKMQTYIRPQRLGHIVDYIEYEKERAKLNKKSFELYDAANRLASNYSLDIKTNETLTQKDDPSLMKRFPNLFVNDDRSWLYRVYYGYKFEEYSFDVAKKRVPKDHMLYDFLTTPAEPPKKFRKPPLLIPFNAKWRVPHLEYWTKTLGYLEWELFKLEVPEHEQYEYNKLDRIYNESFKKRTKDSMYIPDQKYTAMKNDMNEAYREHKKALEGIKRRSITEAKIVPGHYDEAILQQGEKAMSSGSRRPAMSLKESLQILGLEKDEDLSKITVEELEAV